MVENTAFVAMLSTQCPLPKIGLRCDIVVAPAHDAMPSFHRCARSHGRCSSHGAAIFLAACNHVSISITMHSSQQPNSRIRLRHVLVLVLVCNAGALVFSVSGPCIQHACGSILCCMASCHAMSWFDGCCCPCHPHPRVSTPPAHSVHMHLCPCALVPPGSLLVTFYCSIFGPQLTHISIAHC